MIDTLYVLVVTAAVGLLLTELVDPAAPGDDDTEGDT